MTNQDKQNQLFDEKGTVSCSDTVNTSPAKRLENQDMPWI